MKFYVTEEEKRLIDEKMKQLPIKQYGAYFRKMAIDGYILVVDRSDTKAYIRELQAVRQTITDVGLNPDDKRKYKKYSLGMKQRLGVAAAIMEHPQLILVDEPTNALDDKGVAQICQLLRRERERGALIVMTCHDASILEEMCDEIYTIYEGRLERKVV